LEGVEAYNEHITYYDEIHIQAKYCKSQTQKYRAEGKGALKNMENINVY